MPAEEQRDKSGSFRKAETLGGKMGGGKITAENNLPSSRLLSHPLFSKNIWLTIRGCPPTPPLTLPLSVSSLTTGQPGWHETVGLLLLQPELIQALRWSFVTHISYMYPFQTLFHIPSIGKQTAQENHCTTCDVQMGGTQSSRRFQSWERMLEPLTPNSPTPPLQAPGSSCFLSHPQLPFTCWMIWWHPFAGSEIPRWPRWNDWRQCRNSSLEGGSC